MTDVRVFQGGGYVVGASETDEDFDIRATQIGAYALVSRPAEEIYNSQTPIQALVASEESNGLYELYSHQLGAYALVRPNGDRRELRAWTFKQDDHEFYGVNLGTELTLVFDKLTGTWSQWRSPGETHWRVEDVVAWEGINLGCDTSTGILWEIDPEGRLDEDTTPITSVIYGGFTKRFRVNDPCYMAELAISEGQPPSGIDATTVGITLRTSDDAGQSFYDHGTIDGEALGDEITVRWYGLGLMDKPGRVFEITDTGYARRIDALDIEVGNGN